jgi:hypothetical protein
LRDFFLQVSQFSPFRDGPGYFIFQRFRLARRAPSGAALASSRISAGCSALSPLRFLGGET